MAIKPRIGAKVAFNCWEHKDGIRIPLPPTPWTGEVVGISTGRRRSLYIVKRDYDGRTVILYSPDLRYIKEAGK